MSKPTLPRIREAARVILLDEHDRVFLFKVHPYPFVVDAADRGSPQPFWATPGGGLEDGETHEIAALRELEEETGLTNAVFFGWVWSRNREYRIHDEPVSVRERFYLARVQAPMLSFDGHTDEEREWSIEGRWWPVDDIATSDDVFQPTGLAKLLRPILAGDLPNTPIPVGREPCSESSVVGSSELKSLTRDTRRDAARSRWLWVSLFGAGRLQG